MRRRTAWRRSTVAGLLAAVALAGGIGMLAARTEAKGDTRIVPLYKAKKKILGYTPAEWTVQWWQWAFSIPVSVNPLFDETGALVEVGQRGPVWFLGGVFNESGAVTRTATIPAGKALFFPIVNVEWDNGSVAEPLTVEQLRQASAEYIGLVDVPALFLSVDGVEVEGPERGRVASDAFSYAFPADNLGQAVGAGTSRGIYSPAVSDGYWAMLQALPPGVHTIHFGGFVGAPYSTTLDITYDLTVVESNRP